MESSTFEKMKVVELKKYCKDNGIKGISGLKKQDIINRIISNEKKTNEPKNEIIFTPTIQTIYNEDCIVGMKKIKDESADIIICDPPYNIGKDFGNDSDKQDMEQYLLWCDEWIKECIRILKPNGTLYIYGFSEILAFIRVRIKINVAG